ncbi:hypothetical protein CONPUDRAFT_77330 [Coniophora puteana RWD-64-598 SS2]|uniref:Uncharacterized protein n=1 Tax=Coniophora puteana (strain RWD-64-598) TaxID=741705 RepID=A0A5M3M937_CONPW|nr:uncharacterized protein CONPUDRAFT_77330 [Coniophora puteana RWD-64-598 SS2]EIW75718.1 hypothetical protein CONPUDRAFT_77330 [Coniophora puteana RWD-64-598 SS2]
MTVSIPRYLLAAKRPPRRPVRRAFAKPKRTLTPLERGRLLEQRATAKQEYEDALEASRAVIMQEAVKLQGRFGKHSIEHYYEAIMQSSRIKGTKRRLNRWNAHLSKELRTFNDSIPVDGEHKTASQYAKELKDDWNNMSEEERIELTKQDCEELEEIRANKTVAKHNVRFAAWHDATATLKEAASTLDDLAARAGIKILLIGVRSDNTHIMRPFIHTTDDDVETHFHIITKNTVERFAMRLEACSVSGLTGLISNYKDSFLAVKREIVGLVNKKLCDAAGVPFKKTPYSNFDVAVTEKYGIIVDNWPLPVFQSPSLIGSMTELRVLLTALKTSTTKFRKLSQEEWRAWENARFNRAMEQMGPTDSAQEPEPAIAQSPSCANSAFSPILATSPVSTPSTFPAAGNNFAVPTLLPDGSTPMSAPMYLPQQAAYPIPSNPAPAVTFEFVNSIAGPMGHQFASPEDGRRRRGRKKVTA